MKIKRKVLLIGWDAADWKIINALIKEGQMPSMQKFLQNGVYGNIATLDPPFSPMLWTTIATGVRPDKHGILGFVEPDPNKSAVRPVSSTSRKVKAIWNILNQEGYIPHVLGWWPSHPAEPINGIMISNHYQKMNDDKPTKLAQGTIHPKELSGLFSHFRIHPGELTQEHLVPFIPNAAQIDQDKNKNLFHIAKNIAECSSLQACVTWIMDHREWDFLALYLDTIDHFSHGFMNFHPPQMEGVSDSDYHLYKEVVSSAYKYHDMMLGQLLKTAGDDTSVIIVSDHGFHSNHLRPKLLPDEPAGPANQHRNYGVFCMKGPGIKKGERIYGATLLDITPTILTLFDLPVGCDMEGVPLIQSFIKNPGIKNIPSWEDVEGDSGMHPKEFQEDPFDAQESIKQLINLGYIEEPAEDLEINIKNVIKESQYNLARVYIGAGNYREAVTILEKLYQDEPHKGRFAFRLTECLKNLGDIDQCIDIVLNFRDKIKATVIPDTELKKILEEVIPEKLSESEKEKIIKVKQQKLLNNKRVFSELLHSEIIEGELMTLKGDFEIANTIFNNVLKITHHNTGVFMKIGDAYLKMEKWNDAKNCFLKVLESDPENADAFHGMSIVYLQMKDYEKSVEAALNSLQLMYNKPFVHFHLGEALFKYGDYENAEKVLTVCLAMAPNIGKARNYLIEIYDKHIINPVKSSKLKEFFIKKEEYIQKLESESLYEFSPNVNLSKIKHSSLNSTIQPIIVVSGLPRSGTSLMMQIIEKAGIQIYSDNKRIADENNPKGYYEHEAVKRLARDNKWLPDTQGKAVKIIAQLLFSLPGKYRYKIIFMNRDINEIIGSQQKMLHKETGSKSDTFPLKLYDTFLNTLKKIETWSKSNYNAEFLFINHKDLILNPKESIQNVLRFLDMKADPEDLAKVVDQKLYRTKK